MVTLLDTGPILDAMGRLREVYPNVLHIERPALLAEARASEGRADHRKMTDAELFAAFYAQVTDDELTDAQAEAYAAVVDKMRRAERELVLRSELLRRVGGEP
jgi:exonuclease SbcD